MLYTDERKYSMGVTLLQQNTLENEKVYEEIGFWSKTFKETELRYMKHSKNSCRWFGASELSAHTLKERRSLHGRITMR